MAKIKHTSLPFALAISDEFELKFLGLSQAGKVASRAGHLNFQADFYVHQ